MMLQADRLGSAQSRALNCYSYRYPGFVGPSRGLQLPPLHHAPLTRSRLSVAAAKSNPTQPDRHENSIANTAQRLVYAGFSAAACSFLLFQGKAHARTSPSPSQEVTTTTATASASHTASSHASKRTAPIATITAAKAFDAPPVLTVENNLTDVARYKTLQVFEMPVYGKVAMVVAVIMPLMVMGGILYRKAAEEPWNEAVRRMYMLVGGLPGAGGSVDSGKGFNADLVLHLVFWVRLFTYAIAIGIVTEAVHAQIAKVRKGHHKVVESGHTVMVNWNNQTLPVLSQMALAHAETKGELFKGPVVVLAEKDKDEMDKLVAEPRLLDSGLRIITRQGNPANPADQHRAGAATASTVVLLQPESLTPSEASAQQAAVLLALKASGGVRGQKIVVQSAGDSLAQHYDAAQLAVKKLQASSPNQQVAALPTSDNERMHQIMAQVANQPGLEMVFADLLQYEGQGRAGAEFYIKQCPSHLEGMSYQYARRCFDKSTVIGFISGEDQQLNLNPTDTSVLPPGSQLVFVAQGVDFATTKSLPAPYEVSPPALRPVKGSRHPARNITVLCFDSSAAAAAVRNLGEFSGKDSTITLVCESPDEAAIKAIKAPGIHVRVVAGDPSSGRVLSSGPARLKEADSVVLLGLDKRDPKAADMQVVASVLQLHSFASKHEKREQPLAVVATLNNPTTDDVLLHAIATYQAEAKAEAAAAGGGSVVSPVSLHLLQPDELMSGMLTQAACAPQLAVVFGELFSQEKHELYMRIPDMAFGLPLGEPLAWKQVSEAVRLKGETVVGLISGAAGTCTMGLHADKELVFSPGDRLVVVASD